MEGLRVLQMPDIWPLQVADIFHLSLLARIKSLVHISMSVVRDAQRAARLNPLYFLDITPERAK